MADMFKRTITAHDCTNLVGVMPGRPIFQLDYPDGSVVVKPESGGTPIDFRHVSRVMRIADPESAAVALTNRERASLALLAVRFWCNELAAVMESAPVWQKMNLQTHMCDLREAAEKRAGKDDGVVNKTDVRRFATALNREGGLEQLGRICAADAFSANNDRFCFDEWYGMNPGGGANGENHEGAALRCLRNVGNVFIVTADDGLDHLSGLDMFDPNTRFRSWDESIATVENTFNERWPGRLLSPWGSDVREAFSQAVVEDLETVLGERNRRFCFARKKRLVKGAEQRVLAGIEAGAASLRSRFVGPGRTPKDPRARDGLKERFRLLGWID